MVKICLLLGMFWNVALAANKNEPVEKKEDDTLDVVFDLRKNPNPWPAYCKPRMRGEPSQFSMLRKQALANMMANAFTAALDEPNLVFKDRCFATMNTFGSFMAGRIQGFLGEALVGPMGPRIPILDKSGNKDSVVVNCSEVAMDEYPTFFDTSAKATMELVKSMLKNRTEMKKLLNDSLQGQIKNLNYPKAIVQEVVPDSEDPTCVKVKVFSAKESGGYGYGRAFRFCEDSKKSVCADYYGEGVEKLMEQNEARNKEMIRKREEALETWKRNGSKGPLKLDESETAR